MAKNPSKQSNVKFFAALPEFHHDDPRALFVKRPVFGGRQMARRACFQGKQQLQDEKSPCSQRGRRSRGKENMPPSLASHALAPLASRRHPSPSEGATFPSDRSHSRVTLARTTKKPNYRFSLLSDLWPKPVCVRKYLNCGEKIKRGQTCARKTNFGPPNSA